MKFAANALLCDDIRTEKSNAHILIGVMFDNIRVPRIPTALTKLGIYARIHFPFGQEPEAVGVFIRELDGREALLAEFSVEEVRDAAKGAEAKGAPYAGLVASAVAVSFKIPQPGRVLIIVRSGSDEVIAGHLNIEAAKTTDPSTEMRQPERQSPPGASSTA